MRKSYIIFVCTFDPFGKNLYRYEFENRCVDAPEVRLEDESTKIFLNPYGKGQNISRELKDFLEYLLTRDCNSEFTKRLDDEVCAVVENEEWRLEYMTLRMRDRENLEKGLEQGLATGRAESIIDLLGVVGEVPEELREKIYEEKNVDRLRDWLRLARSIESVDEFQRNM